MSVLLGPIRTKMKRTGTGASKAESSTTASFRRTNTTVGFSRNSKAPGSKKQKYYIHIQIKENVHPNRVKVLHTVDSPTSTMEASTRSDSSLLKKTETFMRLPQQDSYFKKSFWKWSLSRYSVIPENNCKYMVGFGRILFECNIKTMMPLSWSITAECKYLHVHCVCKNSLQNKKIVSWHLKDQLIQKNRVKWQNKERAKYLHRKRIPKTEMFKSFGFPSALMSDVTFTF